MKSIKKNIIVKGWLLSYITILLIPVLIGVLIYAEATRVLRTEINRSNQSLLTQIQNGIDSRLEEMDKFGVDLALNKKVESLSSAQNPLTDDERYKMFELMGDLRTTRLVNHFIDYVFVHFHGSNMIVSDSNAQQSRFVLDLLKPATNKNWDSLLKERYIKTYFPLEQKVDHKGKSVMYFRTLIPNLPDSPGVSLMFMFHLSKLLNSLDHIPILNDSSILILNAEDEVIATTSASVPDYSPWLPKLAERNGVLYESDGESDIAISYIRSGKTGWQYFIITSQDVFFQKLIYIRRITICA